MRAKPTLSMLIGTIALAAGASPAGADRSWTADLPAMLASGQFQAEGRRCGTPEPWTLPQAMQARGSQNDCNAWVTTISGDYVPGVVLEIPVVVHVITAANGVTGNISDAMVRSQIDILNEDFMAIPGSPGAAGTYTGIRFVLADTDPHGLPTNGIVRTASNSLFGLDCPSSALGAIAWDPTRYLNIYSNNTNNLGCASLPQWSAGSSGDGVIVQYESFGRNSPAAPYDLGRTATHEVGHWLGLYHPFQGGCASAAAPGCYSDGDLICDTLPDALDTYGCPAGATSCGGYTVPISNFMEYTDDACMTDFTPEQVNRMRCSLLNYRPLVHRTGFIFADGFEYLTAPWSGAQP